MSVVFPRKFKKNSADCFTREDRHTVRTQQGPAFSRQVSQSQRLTFVQFSVIVLKLLLLISKPSLVTITWPFESICVVTVLCVGSVSPHYHSITFHFAAAVGGTDSSAPCRADHNVDPVWSGTYSGPECFVFLPQHLMCRGWRPVESAGSEKRSGQSFLLMPPPPVGNSTAVSLFSLLSFLLSVSLPSKASGASSQIETWGAPPRSWKWASLRGQRVAGTSVTVASGCWERRGREKLNKQQQRNKPSGSYHYRVDITGRFTGL